MGSNVVSLTDRTYMLKLQCRILEDYVASMDKRIKVREVKKYIISLLDLCSIFSCGFIIKIDKLLISISTKAKISYLLLNRA